MKWINPLLLLLLAVPLSSQGQVLGREGNGGDPIALEFQQKAFEGLQAVSSRPELKKKLGTLDIDKIFDGVIILVVDYPLVARSGEDKQFSAAINFPDEKKILINRVAWTDLASDDIKRALAMHEILSIWRIESTGVYSVSLTYLKLASSETRMPSIPATSGVFNQPSNQTYFETLTDWFSKGQIVPFEEIYRTASIGRCFELKKPNKAIAFIMGGVGQLKDANAGPGFPQDKRFFYMYNDRPNPAVYDKFPNYNGYSWSWDWDYFDFVSLDREKGMWNRYLPYREGKYYLTGPYDSTTPKVDGQPDLEMLLVKYQNYYVTKFVSLDDGKPFAACYTFRTVRRDN